MRDSRIGAVSFPHRFGSSLNAHYHYHVLVHDGIFSEGEDGAVRFHEASELTPEHWHDVQGTVQRRVLRYFRRHDLLDASTTGDMPGTRWRWVGRGTAGFSIDASVRIEGHDRHCIERPVCGHRREALVVPGRPSPSSGSTLSKAVPPCLLPTPG